MPVISAVAMIFASVSQVLAQALNIRLHPYVHPLSGTSE
jgi:hypothetical protein